MSRAARMFLAVMASICLAVGIVGVATSPAQAAGRTYYVAPWGSDSNSGTSTSSAWASLAKVNATTFGPGDRIRLRSGQTWNGTLRPRGSGNAAEPIVLDAYGSGSRPKIVGGGVTGGAVQLFNQQYWEINGLDISNWSSTPGFSMGIYVFAQGYEGTLNHIYLRDNYVHDVNGSREFTEGDTQKRTGGITFATNQSTVRTKFDDVRIEGNEIYKVAGEGISIWQSQNNSWHNRRSATDSNWFPHTNIQVRDNVIDGGGLPQAYFATLTSSSQDVLWEGNVVRNWGSCGLEAWNSDDVTYQYNEVHSIYNNGDGNTVDDCAFDADGKTTNITFQYNYVHDTASGFLLYPYGFGDNITVRDNVFEQVGRAFYGGMIDGGTADVYNNTFYSTTIDGAVVDIGRNRGKINAFNNIFHVNRDGWSDELVDYSHNLFFGAPTTPEDPFKVTGNPRLLNPGTGGDGSVSGGPALGTVGGLKIGSGSPAIDAGTLASPNGGRDFWGSSVSPLTAPNIGADNSYNTGVGAGGVRVGGTYSLSSDYVNGYAIGTVGGSTANLAKAEVRPYTGAAHQKWVVTSSGDTLTFTNAPSGKVLEIAGGQNTPGAAVSLWSGNGGLNQKWRFTAGGGAFFLVNSEYQLAMETPGGSYAAGTPVDVWTPNGGPNQKWVLTPRQ